MLFTFAAANARAASAHVEIRAAVPLHAADALRAWIDVLSSAERLRRGDALFAGVRHPLGEGSTASGAASSAAASSTLAVRWRSSCVRRALSPAGDAVGVKVVGLRRLRVERRVAMLTACDVRVRPEALGWSWGGRGGGGEEVGVSEARVALRCGES